MATPHVGFRNSFEVLKEEDPLHDRRTNNVEEVVVCTPDVLLKSGSIGLRAVKEWLHNGRCQEISPITSEIQKLQESRQGSMEADVGKGEVWQGVQI